MSPWYHVKLSGTSRSYNFLYLSITLVVSQARPSHKKKREGPAGDISIYVFVTLPESDQITVWTIACIPSAVNVCDP